jgi:hypothetical protein
MGQPDSRHSLQIQQLCRLNAAMSGNDLIIVIDQHGVVEAKTLYTSRDLLDLLGRVGTGIAKIGPQRMGRPVFEVHIGSPFVGKNLHRSVARPPLSSRTKVLFCDQLRG